RLALVITVLNFCSVILFIYVFTSPVIWNADFVPALRAVYGNVALDLEYIWRIMPKVLTGLVIFGNVVDTVTAIVRALRHSVNSAPA
ncbi:MAG: hypothetical protein PHO15_11140, partial [Eubacteriales bacterium]|nr:hypothetical protein [Eubacteriales bacterium]